jgi:hypothetical protein
MLALAGAASPTGDTVGAENFYQHAEHFFQIDVVGPGRFRHGRARQENVPCTAREILLNVAADHALGMVAAVSVPTWSKAHSVPNRKMQREGLPSMAPGAGPGV